MFNPELLTPEMVGQVQNGFLVRPLKISDYDNGLVRTTLNDSIISKLLDFTYIALSRFLDVLAQLTTVGEISREAFEERFRSMSMTRPLAYYVVVVEDLR